MRNVLLLAIAFSVCPGLGSALGQDPAELAATPSGGSISDEEFRLPVDDELAGEIDLLIAGLGSPEYETREAATTRLTEIGQPAFAKLRAAYHETDQLEVRSRIEQIVRDAYFNYHVFDRNGFLGISQHPAPATQDDDPRIPAGHIGIRVSQIIPGTAAETGGIRAGDIIIALDGEPLSATDMPPTTFFGEAIRLRGPGAGVKLTLLRGRARLEVQVVLGKRPPRYYNSAQQVVYQMIEERRRLFGAWWVRHFRQHPSGTASGRP